MPDLNFVQLFGDNFGRADNTQLGPMWDSGYTGRNTLQIVGNEIRPTVLGAGSFESLNTPVLQADQWIQMTVKTKVIGAIANLHMLNLRAMAPPTNTWYEFQAWDGAFKTTRLTREIDGEWVIFPGDDTTTTWVAGDVMKFAVRTRADGSVELYGYRNGVVIVSHVDTDADRLVHGRAAVSLHVDSGGAITDAEADDVMGGIVLPLLRPPRNPRLAVV